MPLAAQGLAPAAQADAAAVAPAAEDSTRTPTRALFGIQGLEGIGLGVGAIGYPAYRGAATRHGMILPVPYLHYEGDFFKSDKYGVRGDLFNSTRVELSISASLSPPVNSDVPERSGMPDLNPTVELGPQLDIILLDGKVEPVNLRLRLPVRQAITVERSPRSVGIVFSPNLNLDVPLRGWNLGMVTGPIFADRRQHAYFYDVAPQYATPVRPAYQSAGGYSGSQMLLSLSKKMDRLWFGAYLRYDDLHGAAFAGSPLVASKHYLTGGVALVGIYE
ncbi:MAG: hypothetical protein OJF60_000976 [Burkholderiaceae bacterium]|jgi:outer membrane scaffolding protein for murein synthesis (MipA/OmpV family)|nr:MAG: hypothetical protein OJF60_000976 [Burkholderiaceae bacterium]